MERRIALEGLTNFRDLGGYPTAHGGETRWRKMFRSDTLAGLTPTDMETLRSLGIDTACDLRYGEERLREPSKAKEMTSVTVLELGLDRRPSSSFLDSFEEIVATGVDIGGAARDYLMENYRAYPFLYAPAYRKLFDALLAGETVVVHCTAGKDRAGIASAMLLSALGVARETILEDYLLTNQYWDRAGRERPGLDPETTAIIFSAREEYFAAAFGAVEDKHGGVDRYLEQEVGLTAAERARLCEICLA